MFYDFEEFVAYLAGVVCIIILVVLLFKGCEADKENDYARKVEERTAFLAMGYEEVEFADHYSKKWVKKNVQSNQQ